MTWLREQVRQGMNARTYVLLGLLAVTLLWIQSLDGAQKRARSRAASAGTAYSAAVLEAPVKQGPSTPTEPGWGRDPFDRRFGDGKSDAPPRATRAPEPAASVGLYLQGVMNGPSGRTALINGEVYREGDRVGSGEILQIGTRSVLLLKKGTVTSLTLKGDGP